MTAVIVFCDCESKFQDLTYGKSKRVANKREKAEAKCSVCGKIHKTWL